MLNSSEMKYFTTMKNYILSLFSLQISMYPLEHKLFIPMEEGEEVLGCCHKIANSGQLSDYIITIDEPYIRACYYGRQAPHSPYSDNQLIETICHEIAHLYIWEHTKEHKELTNELYRTVVNSTSKNF